jgi:hypothetical protein
MKRYILKLNFSIKILILRIKYYYFLELLCCHIKYIEENNIEENFDLKKYLVLKRMYKLKLYVINKQIDILIACRNQLDNL